MKCIGVYIDTRTFTKEVVWKVDGDKLRKIMAFIGMLDCKLIRKKIDICLKVYFL